MDSTRPAPPSGPPPAYSRLVTRVYSYSLRGPVVFTSVIGFIYGLVGGVAFLNARGDEGETSKGKMFDTLLAVFFFLLAAVEAMLCFIAVMNKPNLSKPILFLTPIGATSALVIVILRFVSHFSLKDSTISNCTSIYADSTVVDRYGTVGKITSAQAKEMCEADWNRDTWRDIVWLVVTLILGFIFVTTALSYYRQLLDPTSIRRRMFQQSESSSNANGNANDYHGEGGPNAYPLQYQQSYPPYNSGIDGGSGGGYPNYVPPYPGPPENTSFLPHPQSGEKHDQEFSESAQREAWEQAQEETWGQTKDGANEKAAPAPGGGGLTGGLGGAGVDAAPSYSSPRGPVPGYDVAPTSTPTPTTIATTNHNNNDSSYISSSSTSNARNQAPIPNKEEDDAWALARETAHTAPKKKDDSFGEQGRANGKDV